MRSIFSVTVLVSALVRFGVAMTTFPQLSLYTGSGGYSATNAANQGSFAISGNLLAKNYAVGTGLAPAPFGSRNVAVVGGTSYIVNFQVNGGNFDYCGTLTQSELTVSGGNLTQTCFAFDFEAANGFLDAFSSTFAAFPPTGAPVRINDQFTFTANSLYNVNVFNVSTALFDSIQQLTINAANGTFVVINIDGTNATFQNFQTTLNGGIDQQHVIYHFYQAVGLTVQAINVQGTILAPNAVVEFNNGQINGSLYAASVDGDGTFGNMPPLTPPCQIIPCPPCPTVAPLPPFTAFAVQNISIENSIDVGTMAAGGNITLFDYSMGVQFNGSCPNALLAGGEINFLNGFVRGNIVAGGDTNLTYVSEATGCSVKSNVGRNNVYDFDGAAAYIKSVSSIYGTRPATKPLVRMYDQVTLETGVTTTGVSVFSFPSSLLAGCSGLNISAPSGQLVLINIPGENNTIADFAITLAGGVDADHVLWNFYNSTVLTIDSVAMIGTVLAPFADVYFNAGDISGGLYANSITGTGEFHAEPPVVPICPVCPVNPCNSTMARRR